MEFFPQLRVFRRHRSSNNPMLVRPSRREVVACYKAGRPQGNLSCVSFLFYHSRGRGYLAFGAHGFASVSVNLLLVFEIFASGNNSLNKLLSIVLHVDAESICAFTTLVSLLE